MDAHATIGSTTRLANVAVCCAFLAAAAMVYYHQGLFMPHARQSHAARNLSHGYSFGNDFYQIWFTARECLPNRSNPYREEITQNIQIGLFGRVLDPNNPADPKDRRAFPYPAFVDLLFWPVSQLSFPVARIVVFAMLLPLTAAMVWLWMKALDWIPAWQLTVLIIALVLTSYPVLEGLYAGQVGLLVGFLMAASILALRKGKLLLSGILMALSTIKPQMSVLLIVYLLFWSIFDLRTRKRFYIGLFSTGGTLVIAALVVWPGWIAEWIHILRAYRGYNPAPLLSQVLGGLFGRRLEQPLYFFCSALLLIGALWLAWRNRSAKSDSKEFWLTLTILLSITTVVILSGQAVYDHILLLPGILFLASQWRELRANRATRIPLAIGSIVLFWPWVAACGLFLLRPILSHDQFFSKEVFLLPLYFAVPLPFLVLAPLALSLRGRREVQKQAVVASS
ncbi:MAG TPA: glycosyltransferase family 87 protein [Candidatus Sulfotelmatobacter sp.]|nr:glycosyltransferase family 87 protein [Candidatus Sulfotelmatobacter sp.]